jgi:hypothetical protein
MRVPWHLGGEVADGGHDVEEGFATGDCMM